MWNNLFYIFINITEKICLILYFLPSVFTSVININKECHTQILLLLVKSLAKKKQQDYKINKKYSSVLMSRSGKRYSISGKSQFVN